MRLTRDEIYLVTGVLLTVVVGAAVKSWRDQQRFALPPPAKVAAKPTPPPKISPAPEPVDAP